MTAQRRDAGTTAVTVWRAGNRPRTEWRNGGGTTRQVASEPAGAGLGDFDWRISIADVRAGGPFSAFDGVDRVIVLVDGPAMDLTVDGARHRLLPYRPFAFDGAADTTCELPAGPTRDLNVMTRRGRVRAAVEVRRLSGGAPTVVPGAGPLVLVALADGIAVHAPAGEPIVLARLDAASATGPGPVELAGAGPIAVVRVLPAG